MDFAEYFGDNLRAAPEPEQFETFEQWAWRLVSEERRAIESLIRESISTKADVRPIPATPAVPPMPDNMVSNSATREAWAAFHSSPRPPREPRPYAPKAERIRRRPLHTIVADPDVRHLLPC